MGKDHICCSVGERSRKTRKDGGEHPTSGEEEGALRLKKRTPLGGAGAIQRCPIPGWRRHEGQKVWVCFRASSRENSKLLLSVYTQKKTAFLIPEYGSGLAPFQNAPATVPGGPSARTCESFSLCTCTRGLAGTPPRHLLLCERAL